MMPRAINARNIEAIWSEVTAFAVVFFLASTETAHAQSFGPWPGETPSQASNVAPADPAGAIPSSNANPDAVVPPADRPIFDNGRATDGQLRMPSPVSPSLRVEPLRVDDEVRVSYAGQNLAVMAGSILLAFTLGKLGQGGVALAVGVGGFYLGPPIVHFAHGNGARGFISLGIGAGATIGGAIAGTAIECADDPCDREFDGLTGFVLGGLAGALTYAIIDLAVLASEPASVASPPGRPETRTLNVAPKVWVAQNQTTFGVSGEF